ncbi:MAG: hypothetical protein ABIW94_05530 [Gemmatimonadaceae bacterium]
MTSNRRAFLAVQLATRWVFASSSVLLLACVSEPSSSVSPTLDAALSARATNEVVVSAAAPDSASRDTTLDVTISGSGFASGAAAKWALAGVTDPAQVRTNSTRYVNSRTLVANITISATATTGKWDIMVTSGSKGGIGTELFTVKVTGQAPPEPTSTFLMSNSASHLLRGDGLYLEGATSGYSGMSRYRDSECGVQSLIYANPGSRGDAVMGSAEVISRQCPSYPRGIRLTFALINGDGSTTSDGSEAVRTFMNVQVLQKAAAYGNPAVYVPVGATELRDMIFNDGSGPKYGKCAGLRFRPVLADGTVTGSDQVRVTRTASDTWVVQTQADETDPVTLRVTHHDKVWCQNNGKLYHMPTYFVVKSAVPLLP